MSISKIKNIVYWALLATVPFIAFIPYIPIGDLGFSMDDILFLFAIGAGLVGLFFIWAKGENVRIKEFFPANIILPFVVFISAGIFSCLYNCQDLPDFLGMFFRGPARFFLTLLFIAVVYYYLDNEKKIKNMLFFLLFGSVAESAFGIGSFLISWQGPFNIGIASSRSYSILSGIVSGRVNGTFGSVMENFTGSNLLASYLAILIPISIVFFIILKEHWQKALAGAILLLQCVCLALTYTRTSIVFVFLSILFFAWLIEKKKVIVWMLSFSLIFTLLIPGLVERFSYDSTDRLDIWKSAALVAKDYPFWGAGPGKYIDEVSGNILKYQVFSFDTESLTPHNFFLYAWAVTGIFALAAMIWIVCAIGRDLWAAFKSSGGDRKVLLAGILASSAGFLMQNFTNNFFFVPTVASYFWVLYAMGLSSPLLSEEGIKPASTRESRRGEVESVRKYYSGKHTPS